MKTQLAKWGNSLAIRIPKAVAEAASLRDGDELEIAAQGNGTIAARKRARKLTLRQLLRGITDENLHNETDWGEARGREQW